MKKKLDSAFILAAGFLWGIISIFVKGLNEKGFSSLDVVAIRCTLTAVILVLFVSMKDKSLLKIKPRDIPVFIGMGVASIVFFNFCYFRAIEITGGAGVPALLLYTAPIFVMILSAIFFKEKLTAKKVVALVLCFSGLIFVTGVTGNSERLSLTAFLFGAGSGLGYGLYSIFGKLVVRKYNSLTITAYTFIFAAAVSLPLSGVIGKASLFADGNTVLTSLGLTVLSTVLPYLLYTEGLKSVDAGKASILATVEPVVAALVGLLFFNEHFSGMKVFGMVIIFSAILLLNINFGHKEKKDENN